jgi:hypothetical protein
MKSSRTLTGALVIGAVAVASMFAAAPAAAATLPPGQKITVVDTNSWQFSNASPVDAALTPIGLPETLGENEYVEATDVNDEGKGYALTTTWLWTEAPEEPDDCEENPQQEGCAPFFPVQYPAGATLYTADANTGKLAGGVPVTIVTGPLDEPILADADSCFALDYTAGKILASCNIYDDEDGSSAWIGYIDPATGVLTPETLLFGEAFVEFQAIAVSTLNGDIWGFAGFDAFLISLDNEEADYVGDVEMTIWAADFDRSGQLWVSAYLPEAPASRVIEEGEEGLAILNLDTGFFDFNAAYSDPAAVINSLTVWGVLAATGSTMTIAPAVAASGVLLLGAMLAAGTMVLRRRSADAL